MVIDSIRSPCSISSIISSPSKTFPKQVWTPSRWAVLRRLLPYQINYFCVNLFTDSRNLYKDNQALLFHTFSLMKKYQKIKTKICFHPLKPFNEKTNKVVFCQRRPFSLGRQTKASRSKPESGLRVVCFSRPLLFFLSNGYSRPGWLAFLSWPAHVALTPVTQ